ncbi:MAG: hypothetical protein QNI89_02380 [Desulfobacterales bacterium]|nr:hypothetical protein [Desulfobacterales bacterium]MDJ0854354.1 hypothetical protein [Desulfobacterales bacterium]MDJ0886114.1 hypothetical protein [Desulfobacterales bacterium]MDJ0990904.1 hypothetical protein [Desulfobacterales bacterium]
MNVFFQPPIGIGLAVLLTGVAILAAVLCIQRFRTAYRLAGQYACAIWFVRGIRCLIIALTATAWAAGFYWQQTWLLIIGLVILAQELYEGFVLSSALRDGLRIENGRAPKGVI